MVSLHSPLQISHCIFDITAGCTALHQAALPYPCLAASSILGLVPLPEAVAARLAAAWLGCPAARPAAPVAPGRDPGVPDDDADE